MRFFGGRMGLGELLIVLVVATVVFWPLIRAVTRFFERARTRSGPR